MPGMGSFLVLLCLASCSAGVYGGIAAGRECNTSTWTGVWMWKNGQFGCFQCDKGERWNRGEKFCEKCDGEWTSCEKNVFHGACSKTSCDNEEYVTATDLPLSTPTHASPTVTNPTDNEPTSVDIGIPTSRMPRGADLTAPISENQTENPKKDEATLHSKTQPPVKDPRESENNGLAVVLGIGLPLLAIAAIVIGIVIKKCWCKPQSTRKENVTDVEPSGTDSRYPLMEEQ